MYQRRVGGGGVLPTTTNGSNYRPSYPVPPSYASGMPSSIDPASKTRKRKGSWLQSIPLWLYLIVITALLMVILFDRLQVRYLYKRITKIKDQKARLEKAASRNNVMNDRKQVDRYKLDSEENKREIEILRKKLETQYDKYNALEAEKFDLIQELEDHHIHHHSPGDTDDPNPQIEPIPGLEGENSEESVNDFMERAEKRENALYERIFNLQEKIQRESAREIVERFGEGPHYVRFDLNLPKSLHEKFSELGSFVIKLASVEEMPHSVHLFLEQVFHELWTGCSFVINAEHILQLGPHSISKPHKNLLKSFQDLKLDKTAYQEYNETYPHKKFTVGFAGRPGGPDFYINKVDNIENHGPGGQDHHTLEEEADPCFGTIVEGKKLLQAIFEFPTRGAQEVLRDDFSVANTELLDHYGN